MEKLQGVNNMKSLVFEKINRIDKSLAKLTKWKRGRNQINKIRDERGTITTDIEKIQRITTIYFLKTVLQKNVFCVYIANSSLVFLWDSWVCKWEDPCVYICFWASGRLFFFSSCLFCPIPMCWFGFIIYFVTGFYTNFDVPI